MIKYVLSTSIFSLIVCNENKSNIAEFISIKIIEIIINICYYCNFFDNINRIDFQTNFDSMCEKII